jgi:hypothetical protein
MLGKALPGYACWYCKLVLNYRITWYGTTRLWYIHKNNYKTIIWIFPSFFSFHAAYIVSYHHIIINIVSYTSSLCCIHSCHHACIIVLHTVLSLVSHQILVNVASLYHPSSSYGWLSCTNLCLMDQQALTGGRYYATTGCKAEDRNPKTVDQWSFSTLLSPPIHILFTVM